MDKAIITMLICLMLALFQAPAAGKTKVPEEAQNLPAHSGSAERPQKQNESPPTAVNCQALAHRNRSAVVI